VTEYNALEEELARKRAGEGSGTEVVRLRREVLELHEENARLSQRVQQRATRNSDDVTNLTIMLEQV
jgi:hypothetical protein